MEKQTDTKCGWECRDGHGMAGGDVLVDCGALSYEVKGAGLVKGGSVGNRHTALNPHLLSEIKPVGSVDAL